MTEVKTEQAETEQPSERVRTRFKKKVRQHLGKMVETKWMDAYARVVAAIDNEQLKAAAEKLKPLVRVHSKLQRWGALGTTIILNLTSSAASIIGAGFLIRPDQAVASFEKVTGGQFVDRMAALKRARAIGGVVSAVGVGEVVAARVGLPYRASGFWADLSGTSGEFVVQKVVNRILHKPSTPVPAG